MRASGGNCRYGREAGFLREEARDSSIERASTRERESEASMGSITPLVFTGVSEFSDDLQTILNRSVAVASIPLQQLQYDQADILTKKQLMSGLRTSVASLATSVSSLGTVGENKALSASSTDTSLVTVSLNGATQAGSYTISNITSVASAASETTLIGYETSEETAVSSDGVLELVVGSNTYEIDLTGEGENTLEGLSDAINALGAGVSASILNTGTGATPYYLSITANATGATTLQLLEESGVPGSNLISADDQGSDAEFELNGIPVTKSDNVINDVIDGVTFTIQSTTEPDEEAVLKLSSNRGSLATALASFVSAYNATRDVVSEQVGEIAGLLSGDYVVRDIQQAMRQLASYRSSGDTINNLADLGIEFDELGDMSFDSSYFYSLPDSSITKAFEYLGSATTGFGALSKNLTAISDPITGLIKAQQTQYDRADDRLSDQIEALATRIDYMQTTLSAKLQQADVLLAQLEAQQTLISASLDSLNLALYGKNDS